MQYKYSKYLLILIVLVFGCKSAETDTLSTETNTPTDAQPIRLSTVDSILTLIEETKSRTDKAFKLDDNSKLGFSLWHDTIPKILRGNKIENLKLQDINDNITELAKLEKPILLQVASTHPNKVRSEIPAMNKLAREFENEIQFIIFLCDGIEQVNEMKKDYYKGISIITTNEYDCGSSINIQGFKHLTGYPYNYYLNKDLEILDCEIGDLEYKSTETYANFQERIYDKVKRNIELLIEKTDNTI